jgi:hypothetical protein
MAEFIEDCIYFTRVDAEGNHNGHVVVGKANA